MINPKEITFFIPVYERYDYFEESITSLLNQTILPGKIIVVDNCSSHSKFKDYVASKSNPILFYIRNESNLGMTGNWNKCIEICDSIWMSILHDDDCLHTDYIARVIYTCNHINEVDAIACACSIGANVHFDEKKIKGVKRVRELNFVYGTLSQFPGVLVKKERIVKAGGFDPHYYPCSDMKLWLDLVRNGVVYFIRDHLAFYRVSKDQTSAIEFLKILNKTCEIRQEIVAKRNSRLIKFLFIQSIIAQYENYLHLYGLNAKDAFTKISHQDICYDIILKHYTYNQTFFGLFRSNLKKRIYKFLVISISLYEYQKSKK